MDMDLAHRRLTPDFTFYIFWGRQIASAMIYACTTFVFVCALFLPAGVYFHSRVTGTCPVTTDLIMWVYVKTTTTIAAAATTAVNIHADNTENATTMPSSTSNSRQHHHSCVAYPYVVYCATYSSTAVFVRTTANRWFGCYSNFARQRKFVSSRRRF